MLVDWRDFDSFYLVKEPKRKEARDLFQLLFDVAPGKHKIEILTTSMIDPAKHKLVVGEQSSAHTLSLTRTSTLAPAQALTLAKTNTPSAHSERSATVLALLTLRTLRLLAGWNNWPEHATATFGLQLWPPQCRPQVELLGRFKGDFKGANQDARDDWWDVAEMPPPHPFHSMSKVGLAWTSPTSLEGLIGRGWPGYGHHTY